MTAAHASPSSDPRPERRLRPAFSGAPAPCWPARRFAACAGLLVWASTTALANNADGAMPAAQLHTGTLAGTNLAALPAGLLDQGLQLTKEAAQALAPARARVVVQAGQPDSRLRLAPCAAGTVSLAPGVPAWGMARLALRCTRGASWNIQIPVKVQVFAAAVVASNSLSSGTGLAADHLKLAEVDWAAHGAPPSSAAAGQTASLNMSGGFAKPALYAEPDLLLGRQLLRPVQAGAPLRQADLQRRQWFAAGATVNVVALGAGYAVTSEAQALSPGVEGQAVRVRTESGRILAGVATGERRVEVRL